MTLKVRSLQNYSCTPEQYKARINASIEKNMVESGLAAKFDELRKIVVEQPKLDTFTSQLKRIKPKASTGSIIISKLVNLFKFVK